MTFLNIQISSAEFIAIVNVAFPIVLVGGIVLICQYLGNQVVAQAKAEGRTLRSWEREL